MSEVETGARFRVSIGEGGAHVGCTGFKRVGEKWQLNLTSCADDDDDDDEDDDDAGEGNGQEKVSRFDFCGRCSFQTCAFFLYRKRRKLGIYSWLGRCWRWRK